MLALNQYREIVGDREFFNFYEKKDHNGNTYYVGNYVSIAARFPSLFEEGISEEEYFNRLRLRDLRGVIFNKDGVVISLPLHKFMNLGEGEDTQGDNVDWSHFSVYDKLDGSMVRPVNFYGDIRWCTKAGITDMSPDIEDFVQKRAPASLAPWAKEMLERGWTPIFEFMSPKFRIVVDYGPQEKMVLLAMRHMETGEYYDIYDGSVPSDIELVKKWEISDPADLLATVESLKGAEGVIVKFKKQWVKVKSLDYVILHKNRDSLEKERYVILNALRELLDDLLPLIPDHVRGKVQDYASNFIGYFNKRLAEMAAVMVAEYERVKSAENPNKEFALTTPLGPKEKSLMFKFMKTPDVFSNDFEKVLRDHVTDTVCIACDQSEANFKNYVVDLFPDRPEWNIWATEE